MMKTPAIDRARRISGVILAACLSGAVTIHAATWTNVSGGSFQAGANWEEGVVPGLEDTLTFETGASAGYEVTFAASVTNNLLYINDPVTFDLQGQTYGWAGNYMYVGYNGIGSIIITNGEINARGMWLGQQTECVGSVTFSGATVNLAVSTQFARRGYSYLRIDHGSDVTMAAFYSSAGDGPVGGGEVVVTGPDTRFKTTGTFNMSSVDASGINVLVQDGAVWTVADVLSIGHNAGSLATMVVDRATILHQADANLAIGRYAVGVLTLRNESSYTHTGDQRSLVLGQLAGGDATLNVLGGSTLITESSTDMQLGRHASSTGRALVSGSGSRIEIGTLYVGGSDVQSRGPGTMTVADQGALTVASNLIVWAAGTLAIDRGTVSAQALQLSAGAALEVILHGAQAGGTALITVSNDAVIEGAVFDLALAAGYTPAPGSRFVLMQADGTLTGEFAGLEDGATVWTDPADPDFYMWINYNLGGNDSITLTVIPEPGSLALLALAGLGVLAVRRPRPGGPMAEGAERVTFDP